MKTLIFILTLSALQVWANESLRCVAERNIELQRVPDGKKIATYENWELCEQARLAAEGDVVCAYFKPGMPIGAESWQETGWRPMNLKTGVGLGRKVIPSFDECLEISRNARGGIVCTQTGLGYKPTNVDTNMWCGASAQMKYCNMAARRANDFTVCTFPSSGSGAEKGWVKTRIGATCEYQGNKLTVEECSNTIPSSNYASKSVSR